MKKVEEREEEGERSIRLGTSRGAGRRYIAVTLSRSGPVVGHGRGKEGDEGQNRGAVGVSGDRDQGD